jgi:SNF2 family DNA or RNA helicase
MRTYGALALDGEQWVISDLEPHVAIRLKAIFPKVPKASAGPFTLPADGFHAADLEWFTSRYPLAVAAEAAARLAEGAQGFRDVQAEVGRIFSPDYTPPLFPGLKPGQEVRPHQARTVDMLARFRGILCGDDMGEGKTYTGGAACLIPGALPATIVCPPNLRLQWHDKLREFTTLDLHVIVGGKPYNLPPVDVRIMGYTQLEGWADVLDRLGNGLVVFDEMHELRAGTSTGKGHGAKRLAEASRYRLGMTGTPIFNYGDEIWRLMRFLRPEVLGDLVDFIREWCRDTGREVKDPKALGTYLREQHVMVRKVSDGPRPNVLIKPIDYDVDEMESVEEIAGRLAYTAMHGAFMERGQAVRELDLRVRHQTGVAKAKSVAAYVRILVEAGEPLILFGWHREVYDIWIEALSDLGVVMYTGSESPAQKRLAVDAFLSGRANVFIMSLRSGAGLDGLQARAKTCVFGELDWSPSMHAQCIGRINREGQACWPDPVTAIYLVADDGSDPPMMDVLGLKASQAAGIVDPTLGPVRNVRDDKPIERLIRRYLEARAA